MISSKDILMPNYPEIKGVDCVAKRRGIKKRGVPHMKGLMNNGHHLTSSTRSNYDRKES